MNLVSEHILSDETAATWLAANGAVQCHRLNATITTDACLTNMYVSERKSTDLRCAGCGGLDNQPGPERSFLPPVVVEKTAIETPEMDAIPMAISETEVEEELALEDFEDNESGFVLAITVQGIRSDSFDKKLLAMLEATFEEEKPRPVRNRRFAVFMGRCPRCGGYMANSPEPEDFNVYRCFGCGWRSSPEYQQNRLLCAV
jgi:hypothetical protein